MVPLLKGFSVFFLVYHALLRIHPQNAWCTPAFWCVLPFIHLIKKFHHQDHQNRSGFRSGTLVVIALKPHVEHNYPKSFYPQPLFSSHDPSSSLRHLLGNRLSRLFCLSMVPLDDRRVYPVVSKASNTSRPTDFTKFASNFRLKFCIKLLGECL